MKRIHLFEFTDQAWYPQLFRVMQTDYLQFVTTRGAGHQNLVPLLKRVITRAGSLEIVDLCSGGSGPWVKLSRYLADSGLPVHVTLTDKYPNPEAVKKWSDIGVEGIVYLDEPVNADDVPDGLHGIQTIFEGFHHFKPEQAQQILMHAYEKGAAIGIFEASLPRAYGSLIFALSPLMTLLGYFFATPFIRPRNWQRFLWTYLLPIVPLATCWDGLVSFLRVYTPEGLRELVGPYQREDYQWEIGQAPTGTPLFVFTYLIGYPLSNQMG